MVCLRSVLFCYHKQELESRRSTDKKVRQVLQNPSKANKYYTNPGWDIHIHRHQLPIRDNIHPKINQQQIISLSTIPTTPMNIYYQYSSPTRQKSDKINKNLKYQHKTKQNGITCLYGLYKIKDPIPVNITLPNLFLR